MREIFKAFAEAGHMAEKITDAETLGDSFDAIIHADELNDGFEKRKVGLGRLICPVRDIKPQNVWEAIRHHKRVARELSCNTRFGCFIELENWPGKRYVRTFRVEEPFDSYSMSVDMAGEALHFVAIGMKSWDDEKKLRREKEYSMLDC